MSYINKKREEMTNAEKRLVDWSVREKDPMYQYLLKHWDSDDNFCIPLHSHHPPANWPLFYDYVKVREMMKNDGIEVSDEVFNYWSEPAY
jgi:hypothetical protein